MADKQYFLVTERFAAGDDAVDTFYITSGKSKEEVKRLWCAKNNIDEDESSFMTLYGNMVTLVDIQRISMDDYNHLSRFLAVVEF